MIQWEGLSQQRKHSNIFTNIIYGFGYGTILGGHLSAQNRILYFLDVYMERIMLWSDYRNGYIKSLVAG